VSVITKKINKSDFLSVIGLINHTTGEIRNIINPSNKPYQSTSKTAWGCMTVFFIAISIFLILSDSYKSLSLFWLFAFIFTWYCINEDSTSKNMNEQLHEEIRIAISKHGIPSKIV